MKKRHRSVLACTLVGLTLSLHSTTVLAAKMKNIQSPDAALISAAEQGDFRGVKKALGAGANVNAAAKDGATAVECAGYRGRIYDIGKSEDDINDRLNIIELLISKGAVVNTPDTVSFAGNIMTDALAEQRYDLVDSLLQNGADATAFTFPNLLTTRYKLHPNPNRQQRALFEKLLSGDQNLQTLTNALYFAVRSDDAAYFVNELLQKGADVNDQSFIGATPLIEAILAGKPKIVQLLVNSGAKPDVPYKAPAQNYSDDRSTLYNGKTPLAIAKEILAADIKIQGTSTATQTVTLPSQDPDNYTHIVGILKKAGAK
jgi:hypothetical protein